MIGETVYTTLRRIKDYGPCQSGWKTLLKGLGKSREDDEPLPLSRILEINGLEDTLWCLRAVDGFESEKRLLAVAYAREVQHLMTDPRAIESLDVAERYAKGQATANELYAARNSAWAGQRATSNIARYAEEAAEATLREVPGSPWTVWAPWDAARCARAAMREAAWAERASLAAAGSLAWEEAWASRVTVLEAESDKVLEKQEYMLQAMLESCT